MGAQVRRIVWLVVFAAAAVSASSVLAYVFIGIRWPDGPIVMHLQLGSQEINLIDDSGSWNRTVEFALGEWNTHLDDTGVEFRVVRDSTASIASLNGTNNVFWSSTIFGRSFGDSIGWAQWSYDSSDLTTETDVIINSTKSWNSYRGPLRRSSSGARLSDIRRVALHEFGHALGLNHPNEAGQSVLAQMNSSTSDFDTLSIDDANGARALYGAPLFEEVNFPPRDDSFNFRRSLEDIYRVDLQRVATSSFVDLEGAVVWTQEYLRYRANQCSHASATDRTFMQIRGQGIQPVCGLSAGGTVLFPPRDDSLNFRNALERVYFSELGRSGHATFVDNEGDVVWIQEYLRLRVNGYNHQDATNQVIEDIRRAAGV